MTDLESWHKSLGPVVGAMAIACARRRARRSDMDEWARVLEEVAGRIRKFVADKKKEDNGP